MTASQEADLRLDYRKRIDGPRPHVVWCDIPKSLPSRIVKAVLVAMRRINLLENLSEGSDYAWEGATRIAFRREEDVALYKLFVVLPDATAS